MIKQTQTKNKNDQFQDLSPDNGDDDVGDEILL